MNTEHISCPHCNSPMIHDGSLAGQRVSCPTCHGQFQMPPIAPPVAIPRPIAVEAATPFINISQTPRRSAVRRPPGLWATFRLWVTFFLRVAALLFLFCGFAFLLVVFISTNTTVNQSVQPAKDTGPPPVAVSEQRVAPSWQIRGYQEGYAAGLRIRNNDLEGAEPAMAMYFQIRKNQNEIGDRSHLRYEISPEYPQRGTNEYGDYKTGFEQGFNAGQYGLSR